MTNVHELRTEARRYDVASTWIAKLDRELSEGEAAALKGWMAADPENATVLLQMAALWDKMDTLSRLADVVPHATPRVISRAPVWFAAAASLLVVVLAGTWRWDASSWFDSWDGPGVSQATTDRSTYETAVGAQSTVDLSDGTEITLNTNSRIRVNYTGVQRLVFLEHGEIHLQVAHDASRPLSVIAGNRVVQAVGTAFTVKIDSAQKIELVVTDGRVRVGVRPVNPSGGETAPPALLSDSTLSVAKGEEVMLGSPNEAVTTLTPDDIEVRLSWRHGNLIFRGEPLGDAVAEISRYTPVEFVFMTDDLQKVRIAGLFKAGDVAGFLAALQTNFDIAYERVDADKILLKRSAAQAR